MKTLIAIAALVTIGLLGGWLVQSYTLPRVGLHALSFGEYAVAFLLLTGTYTLIAIAQKWVAKALARS